MNDSPSAKKLSAREEAIFYDALQIQDSAAREAFLQEACGGERTLRAAIDDLLSAHERAEDLFRQSSAALKLPAELAEPSLHSAEAYLDAGINTSVGPYKLTQWLGEGGGGVVYLAEQEEPVRRQVALKILKPGMDTKRVIARFEAERQTLAMMEHPNIARVLDAGATETGRPYFVMELVRGVKITDFCVRNEVSLAERLRLFQQVCQAIQHAHQKGIIHRDLKPSNILIALHDGVPVPKVIDFGIAKAIWASESGTRTTIHDQPIGTPAYMSPEQVRGALGDVDTRSDIYSLGVVLYELLVGRPPFSNEDLLRAGVDEMRRRLQSEDPLRPSIQADIGGEAKATSELAPEKARWAASLRGDLDWIVMKALEKERDRRYQTVRGLWLDLERYLTNEPVEARPPSRIYRLRKMVRRNRILFAGLGSATLALIAGLTTSTWLFFKARSAERQQTRLRAVAEQALRQEAVLRRQAEVREQISRAAILLLQRRFAEADAVVSQISDRFSEPSVEAANVFRGLTEWHALREDFPAAAQRSLRLLEVNRFDESEDTNVVSRDLVVAAPVLIEAREYSFYEEIRTHAVSKFANTSSPVAAEQVLKISLLVPPPDGVLPALEGLAQTEEKCVGERNASVLDRAWGSAVLGLLEYRRGAYEKAADWCGRSRAFSYRNKAHQALCLAVEAMSRWRLGQRLEAKGSLEEGRLLVEGWFARPSRTAEAGAWNDWLIARILTREARQTIDPPADF